ncbi:PREDICTED: uncharacterized protein LOC104724862 [Camelina sativa]|uniref:Uncharacterized protein LOC104724862 n=1 Tax=Camelina sativa TaxID=90675 RepID=A0ABM0UIQ3_CAMSA|nr:PREDICTED: uncharacterized protein LOC104724862 [Camelina sativa]
MDVDSQPEPLRKLISFISQNLDSEQKTVHDSEFMTLVGQTLALKPEPELISLYYRQILSLDLFKDSDSDPESELVSLIFQLTLLNHSNSGYRLGVISLITQIISLVETMDLDSQPKEKSELLSLATQTISVFNSMDSDSQPEPLPELLLLISQASSPTNSRHLNWAFRTLVRETMCLDPEPELVSLIYQIFSLVISMYSKSRKFTFLCPQQQVRFENGKFHVVEEEVLWSSDDKWYCLPYNWENFGSTGEDATLFFCRGCNGKNHQDYDKAPVVIKHTLHPKHSLQFVMSQHDVRTRICYCCDEDLNKLFYYCSVCDLAIDLACVEKPPVLSIDHPKRHEHPLTLFPKHASLTCDVCGLSDSGCPFYICSPCGFVVHQKCANLPRVIKISRHPHRLSFSPWFDQGELACNVCERKIGKDYGCYSCIKEDCLFAVHPKCAIQSNVWDGVELEGVPEGEDDDDEGKPFVRISDGIIQHFSHQQHHLRLATYTDNKNYDENKMCQACIMPIYFGSFYSCMQCEFILHEVCANFPLIIYHPIHPHWLTLVVGYDGVMTEESKCSACPWLCTAGLFYKCHKELCSFKLDVQCATFSEPLVHQSHIHPLFLTSKPGEQRRCNVCKVSEHCSKTETFNCIECDFALCFKCATLPPKVRYTDDEHVLALSYGEKTSTKKHWCEECEGKIDQSVGFYLCDESCCVALHIECLLGVDLYMIPGSSWFHYGEKVDVLLNNRNTSRPICTNCKKRCPHKIVLQCSGFIFCSTFCIRESVDRVDKIP